MQTPVIHLCGKRLRHSVRFENGRWLIDLGAKHIWDGSDLDQLRTSFASIASKPERRVAVDLDQVLYLQSGVFGSFCDWIQLGWRVWVLNPKPAIQGFLWFREFCLPNGNGFAGDEFEVVTPAKVPIR